MRLIVATGNEGREVQEFRQRNSRFLDSLLSMQMTAFLASALPGAVLTASTAIVFIYGGRLVIENQLTIGSLVAFMAYHLRLLGPVQVLLTTHTNLLTGGVALGRVFEILDVQPDVRQLPTATARHGFRGEITFDRVRFRYADDVPVLEDISFHIPAGKTCAIVGASGTGKSTVADLSLRFYDPDSGSILIDGLPLRSLRLQDVRREIALVEQTPLLFRATVKENIAYGSPTTSMHQIREAARAAAIDDFIGSLPEGYDTVIGERGCTISAGERQRLALARALLRKPAILIMDEPTSALDQQSEAAISRTIAEAAHTVILITHRMSLAAMADIVLVLEGGRIVEAGHPSDLKLHSRAFSASVAMTTQNQAGAA
jgi:ATP-binding cassette subfamily B protein